MPAVGAGKLRRWIERLKTDLVERNQQERSTSRVLTVLKMMFEKTEGGEAAALQILQEYKMLAPPKAKEPPLEEKRKTFMKVYREADPVAKRKLEKAALAGGDAVLIGEIEVEKATA